MSTIFQKIYHAKSGCPDCRIVLTASKALTSGFYNDVQISDSCRKKLDRENNWLADHECDGDGLVDVTLCTECREHAGFCSICGGSNCCGAGSYEVE